MAGLLKDKTPEQVRDMLGLEVYSWIIFIFLNIFPFLFKDDLTEEEKEEIRQQNIWAQY
jgi:hypothetical protein